MGSTGSSGLHKLVGQEESGAGAEKEKEAATSPGDVLAREKNAEERRESRPPGAGAG